MMTTFFDWEDDEGLLEEDSDIDSNSLHDLLLGLADSDQPQDKTVNKVSYPKRLLDNTMKKRYAKAGFTEEKLDFLHKFFQGAVNLYGVIEIIDLSQIYADIKSMRTLRTKINTQILVPMNLSSLPNWCAVSRCHTMSLTSMSSSVTE